MSYENVYQFAYARGFIPIMQGLKEEYGGEKFVKMLQQKASDIPGGTPDAPPAKDSAFGRSRHCGRSP